MLDDPLDNLDPTTLAASRKARGISAQQLADLAGTHVTTIRRVEAGVVDPRVEETWAGIVRALQSVPLLAASAAASQ